MTHMYCTECPNECFLSVEKGGSGWEIGGYKCPNGLKFAEEELTCPKRVLTSTVLLTIQGREKLLPVRTDRAVPLERQKELMEIIRHLRVRELAERGQVIVKGIGGLDADLIASASARSVL